MKKIIKDYFTFSKKERIAASILLLLIGGFVAMPYLIPTKKIKPLVNKELQDALAKIQGKNTRIDSASDKEENFQTALEPVNHNPEIKSELFAFDPNTIDANGWKRLGLRDKTITTILNYRAKGGKFRNAADIGKIWGLKKEEAERLMAYVQIEAPAVPIFTPYPKNKITIQAVNISPIDINTATVEQFMQLPGIGRSLPYRILKFRDKLGGFFSVQQVKETYGMSDSVFQSILPYLKIEPASIKKININTASDFEISRHPYISREIAKAIVIYRTQHGPYRQLEDVKKIVFITQEMFDKIVPYITVQ